MKSTNSPTPRSPVVCVVDDDESVRTAVARLLKAGGYEVRTYASVGEFLLERPRNRSGCLVLDVRLPGPSGLELQDAFIKQGEAFPIIFLSGHGDIPLSVRAMKAGAVDFLTKPVRREALLNAVQTALARDAAHRSLYEQLSQWLSYYKALSPREREVFDGVVAGKPNKQIAAELKIAERTVKAHRAQVMHKMRVTSLAELVQVAVQLRAVKPASGSTNAANA